MPDTQGSDGIWDTLWEFFASVRLTIILLLSLAGTSIIGTLIPQNKQPMEYLQTFGEFGFRLLSALDFFDMYRSWWFRLLIMLLVLNIIICSIERLASLSKIIFVKKPHFRRTRFQKARNRSTFHDDRSPEALQALFLPVLKQKFGYTQLETTDGRRLSFCRKMALDPHRCLCRSFEHCDTVAGEPGGLDFRL